MTEKPKGRPKIDLPLSVSERVGEAVAAGLVVSQIILVSLSYSILPENVPLHFGTGGNPDGWGPRSSIWFVPLVTVALHVLLTAVGRVPHRHNYPWRLTAANAAASYRMSRELLLHLKIFFCGLFLYVSWATRDVALDLQTGLSPLVLPMILLTPITRLALYFVRGRRIASINAKQHTPST